MCLLRCARGLRHRDGTERGREDDAPHVDGGAIPHYYGGTMQGMVFTDGKAVTQHNIADLASSIGVILSDYKAQIVTLTVGKKWHLHLKTMVSHRKRSAAARKKRSRKSISKVLRTAR